MTITYQPKPETLVEARKQLETEGINDTWINFDEFVRERATVIELQHKLATLVERYVDDGIAHFDEADELRTKLAEERQRAEAAEKKLEWHSPKHDGLDYQRHGGPQPEADIKWLNIEFRCTCGSGAHPRICGRHPLGWRLHTAELRDDMAFADDDERGSAALDTTRIALQTSEIKRKALREACATASDDMRNGDFLTAERIINAAIIADNE